MARSRRYTPIHSIAQCKSGKQYKRKSHRARRVEERSLIATVDPEILDPLDFPDDKEYGDPWADPRDGKTYMKQDDYSSPYYDKLMRK